MNHDIYSSLDQVSMEDLERLARTISMESALGNGLQFKTKLHAVQFFRNAGSFFSKFKLTALNISGLSSRDLDGIVGKVGYVDASNKNVIVPEGFIGQWVPYSAALKETMGKAIKMEYMIRSFNDTLGRIINDPYLMTSVSGIGHMGPSTLGLTDDMKAIGKTFFDPRSNHITRTLGSVIERQVDIKTTTNNINDAAALDRAHPAKKSLDAVARTMDLADTLMGAIQSRTADKGMSNQEAVDIALQELVDLTLCIAKEMESYGTLLYRIRQFSESLKDSIKEIKK